MAKQSTPGLGRVWRVQEQAWSGTWTLRPDGRTFDAHWRHGGDGREQRDVIVVEKFANGQIVLLRRSLQGRYTAKIPADGRHIQGGHATWYPAGDTWSAVIEGSAPSPAPWPGLGRTWKVQEQAWSGVWTLRADGRTFDAHWRHAGDGREQRDVLVVEKFENGQIVILRQGIRGRYTAKVSADRRRVQAGHATWYPAGDTWSAFITP